ncbi:MAG: DNA replication/repair protein RecF [Candidatus Muiribacteriota bacterium]
MNIKNLKIKGFRNISNARIDLENNFNIFLGRNGQGKTNLLESVYFSGLIKSFKTKNLNNILTLGKEEKKINISSLYLYNNGDRKIDIEVEKKSKKIFIDNVPSDFDDLLAMNKFVTFTPDDLKIIKKEPANRRKFINEISSQIFPSYYKELLRYCKILGNRNILLKNKQNYRVWDDIFIESANFLLQKRKKTLENISNRLEKIYNQISGTTNRIEIKYTGEFSLNEEMLRCVQLKDERRGFTSIGPHRNDLKIYIDGKNSRNTASQGQIRTLIISLKIAQAQIIENIINEKPILILDDVFSELDLNHQKGLLEFTSEGFQVFISANNIDKNILDSMENKKVYYINGGEVEEKLQSEKIYRLG